MYKKFFKSISCPSLCRRVSTVEPLQRLAAKTIDLKWDSLGIVPTLASTPPHFKVTRDVSHSQLPSGCRDSRLRWWPDRRCCDAESVGTCSNWNRFGTFLYSCTLDLDETQHGSWRGFCRRDLLNALHRPALLLVLCDAADQLVVLLQQLRRGRDTGHVWGRFATQTPYRIKMVIHQPYMRLNVETRLSTAITNTAVKAGTHRQNKC